MCIKQTVFRGLIIAFFGINAGLVLYQFASNAVPYCSREIHPGNSILVNGYDFSLRLNELTCIREGIDPFKIWDEKVGHAKFYPHDKNHLRTITRNQPVNAYTPWGYTFMLPLSFLPEGVAWWLHYALMFFSLLLCSATAFYVGYKKLGSWEGGLFCSSCSLMIIFGVWTDVRVGNLSLIISAMMCLMALFLRSGHDILAGVCWSFAMIKPQVSLLLLIPLTLHRKYLTILVAGIICVVLSLPPATMCGVSPVEMILEAPKGSTPALGDGGCTFLPVWIIHELLTLAPIEVWLFAGIIVGFTICVYCVARLRHQDDWFVLFVPPVVLSVSWTYTQTHAYSICWICLMVIAVEIWQCLRNRDWRTAALLSIFLICTARGGDYFDRVLYRIAAALGFAVPQLCRQMFVWVWAMGAVVMLVWWCRQCIVRTAPSQN